MGETPKLFANNAAVPYAAFNLRDPYYREMASYVAREAALVHILSENLAVDLGCGIGISTLEIAELYGQPKSFCARRPGGKPLRSRWRICRRD